MVKVSLKKAGVDSTLSSLRKGVITGCAMPASTFRNRTPMLNEVVRSIRTIMISKGVAVGRMGTVKVNSPKPLSTGRNVVVAAPGLPFGGFGLIEPLGRGFGMPICLSGSTGITAVNRFVFNTKGNARGVVFFAIDAKINKKTVLGNGVCEKDASGTLRVNRSAITSRAKVEYGYNGIKYLRTISSNATVTEETERTMLAGIRASLGGCSAMASCRMFMRSTTKSGITARVESLTLGCLKVKMTGTVTVFSPSVIIVNNKMSGTNRIMFSGIRRIMGREYFGSVTRRYGVIRTKLKASTKIIKTITLTLLRDGWL